MFDHMGWWVVIGGIAAAGWQQLRRLLQLLGNWLIQQKYVSDTDASVTPGLRAYLQRYRHLSLDYEVVQAASIYVRTKRRRQLVLYRGETRTRLYFVRGWPLLVITDSSPGGVCSALHFYYLRRTIDFARLFTEAAEYTYQLTDSRQLAASRFCVRWLTGSRGVHAVHIASNGGAGQAAGNDATTVKMGITDIPRSHPIHDQCKRQYVHVYGWDLNELTSGSILSGSAVDRLALPAHALSAVQGIKDWKDARDWYLARDIPWRHGILLHGAPGNGKSRLVAALGQDLDMPILTFDLASMTNRDFIENWQREVSASAPCIVLFEDIDSVFHGRRNVVGADGLTFDCFLNMLSGADTPNGVLTIITTNDTTKLDPAIAQVRELTSRPGRIEVVVAMGPPDAEGRRKIAQRVLVDHPCVIDTLVAECDGYSGAQFLDRCRTEALALRNRGVPSPELAVALKARQDLPLTPSRDQPLECQSPACKSGRCQRRLSSAAEATSPSACSTTATPEAQAVRVLYEVAAPRRSPR